MKEIIINEEFVCKISKNECQGGIKYFHRIFKEGKRIMTLELNSITDNPTELQDLYNKNLTNSIPY